MEEPAERPYILCAIYYLAILSLVGGPIWYYTCSQTRYSLPELDKLDGNYPRLDLDISVVQLMSAKKNPDYLRANLPPSFNTSIDGLVYNVNWRIRRPTQEETQLIKAGLSLDKLEENMLKIHKPANRFKIFMYLFEDICDRSQTYLISSERFVYLCPNGTDEDMVRLINQALHETYFDTVDLQRAKKILSAKTDLLVSLISETNNSTLLSQTADKVHSIYEKNVKRQHLELAEILNIRLLTQNVFDLVITNPSQLYNSYEMRLNKHSSQSVNHVMTLLPNSTGAEVKLSEERDSNFILIGDSDKSLVLGFRAVIRRLVGLKSPNLCKSCLISRDAFINKWELDAIVGVLTALKLESVFTSLSSVSQQTVGIRIPKYASDMAHESYDNALKSLESLATKKPLEAYRLSSAAYDLSESAYYDPSLLETSYYPRETRWAIYTPLVLPLVLPILMSIVRVVTYLIYGSSSGKSHVKQKMH